eukprot:2386232-Rhodomonas_salina.1
MFGYFRIAHSVKYKCHTLCGPALQFLHHNSVTGKRNPSSAVLTSASRKGGGDAGAKKVAVHFAAVRFKAQQARRGDRSTTTAKYPGYPGYPGTVTIQLYRVPGYLVSTENLP